MRISHQHLYQYIAIPLSILKKNLAQADGRDIYRDCIQGATRFSNSAGVAAGKNSNLATFNKNFFNTGNVFWKGRSYGVEAEDNPAIVFPDLIQRHIQNGTPAVDHKDVVCYALNFRKLMRGKEDSRSMCRRCSKRLQQVLNRHRVKSFSGFVKNE